MTTYAIISNDPHAFFLGRYPTKQAAAQAAGNDFDKWVAYEQIEMSPQFCEDYGRCNCQKGHCDKGLKN